MKKLIQGIQDFQSRFFRDQRELFERLATGQKPETLLITCSDSRIDPNLITQTKPGELFVVRNAGNIVPPHGVFVGGEEATIEFALVGLGIKEIVVCGHSHCGAIQGLLNLDNIREKLPAISRWLGHAEATRRIMREKYTNLSDADQLNVAIQENVLVQLENLRTHPAVAAGLARGDLSLHGWVYKIETGQIFAYEREQGQFLVLSEQTSSPIPPLSQLTAACSI